MLQYTERPVHTTAYNVSSRRPNVTIYSDGSYKPNLDVGGYGAMMTCQNNFLFECGARMSESNNRMELLGVLMSLRRLNCPCEVLIISDSRYVIDGISGYIWNWQANGWVTSQGKPVANRDLWEEMLQHMQYHVIHCEWVKGHAGHPANEMCDRLATYGAFSSVGQSVPGTKEQMNNLFKLRYPGAEDDEIEIDFERKFRKQNKKKTTC